MDEQVTPMLEANSTTKFGQNIQLNH